MFYRKRLKEIEDRLDKHEKSLYGIDYATITISSTRTSEIVELDKIKDIERRLLHISAWLCRFESLCQRMGYKWEETPAKTIPSKSGWVKRSKKNAERNDA